MHIETDGSMIFTREDGWKEVKVGRIFKFGDCIRNDGEPGCILHLQYMARMEDSRTFSGRMDDLIDAYRPGPGQLVFLSDGATWLRKWVEDARSGAISILDYLHASEHLYDFVKVYFKDESEGKTWGKVIKNTKKITGDNNKAADNLIDYYKTNQDRMKYNDYRKIGCRIIGSSAIESAHRTLVQKPMKLSGQTMDKERSSKYAQSASNIYERTVV